MVLIIVIIAVVAKGTTHDWKLIRCNKLHKIAICLLLLNGRNDDNDNNNRNNCLTMLPVELIHYIMRFVAPFFSKSK